MLADGGNRVHARFETFRYARWQHRLYLAGRRVDIPPPGARAQLCVIPDFVHVVHARVADLGIVEAADDFLGSQFRKCLRDDQVKLLARGRTAGARGKSWIGLEVRLFEHPVAEHRPFPFVLQPEHYHLAIAGGKGPIGIDGRMRRAGTDWWLRALVGIVERKTHPLDHALSMEMSMRLPLPV